MFRECLEPVVEALKNYGKVDLNKYIAILQESLQYLTPGKESLPTLDTNKKPDKKIVEKPEIIEEMTKEEPIDTETETKTENKEDDKFQEIENTVFETIKKIEGEDGAPWDSITEKCEKTGLDKDSIEEALTSLMDKGLIYEPILGTIKTT